MNLKIIINILLSSIIVFSCGLYSKLDLYQDCQEFYSLSGKTYKIDLTSDLIIDSWEDDGYHLILDTLFRDNGKRYSPQIKIYGYKDKNMKYNINYINFMFYGSEETRIQLFGVCFKEKLNKQLTIKELKEINEMIKNGLINRFIK